jgi:hypothetical protein
LGDLLTKLSLGMGSLCNLYEGVPFLGVQSLSTWRKYVASATGFQPITMSHLSHIWKKSTEAVANESGKVLLKYKKAQLFTHSF